MKVELEVEEDSIEQIVLESLKQSFAYCDKGDEKTVKALRRVIRFYSTPTQWKAFKEQENQ